MTRIALFGGTFDPVHRGHLAIASAAADALALDIVFFAPVGRQPLKVEETSASFSDRLRMVELACDSDDRFAASELDAPRADGSLNYSLDAMKELRRQMPDARLFMLSGVDSFLELPRWREPQRLLELAEWIVVSRPGFSLEQAGGLQLTAAQFARVHVIAGVNEEVSATELRSRLRSGEDCSDLLPQAVAEYIREHGLYRS